MDLRKSECTLPRRAFLGITAAALARAQQRPVAKPAILDTVPFQRYIEEFNRVFHEDVVNFIPDARAWEWLSQNIPLFTCPDSEIERLYYYRWWTYRKHIKQTPAGFLVTEFLKPVTHAGEYNSLSCALGHHIAEGRWLADNQFIDSDIHFWLRTGENGGIRKNLHQFSGWVAAAIYDRWLADARADFAVSFLDPLIADYKAWEQDRLTPTGLFWQRDVSDGMESSISGGRNVKNIRPSINSYMYGNAKAIAAIAGMAGKPALTSEYGEKSERLLELILQRLWNRDAAFFETRVESGGFAPVRENIGFTPWYFDLPEASAEFHAAWKQLIDSEGFYAPYGPTTAERRNPQFQIPYEGDDCQWNGPSWPFSTTITLRAMANVINREHQSAISRDDYFRVFEIYSRSQRLKLEDGRTVPFIDEDLNPLTGEWLARAMKIRKKTFYGRGDHYNHSAYADLVVTGIAGLRPRADSTVEVNPLITAKWDWFCLDRVPYHGRSLTILWDKSGGKFGKGKGLRVFADAEEIAHAADLGPVSGNLA